MLLLVVNSLLACASLLLISCSSPQPLLPPRNEQAVQPRATSSPQRPLPPIDNFTTTLEDEVRDIGANRIRWSTYWKVSWADYPGAVAYEIQTVTSEGASPRLRRQIETSKRIEIVVGENKRSEGLLNRERMIGQQSGQLSYRVRAVLPDNRVSEWSRSVAVSKPKPTGL